MGVLAANNLWYVRGPALTLAVFRVLMLPLFYRSYFCELMCVYAVRQKQALFGRLIAAGLAI